MSEHKNPWITNGFYSNFNIAVNRLGYENAPIAFGLAMSDWESENDLVDFLSAITKR